MRVLVNTVRYIRVPCQARNFSSNSATIHNEERTRLRVFENKVLRKKFGPKTDEVKGNGENYLMKSFVIWTLTQYCSGDKIENETGGACSTYGGEERCIQGFDGEN